MQEKEEKKKKLLNSNRYSFNYISLFSGIGGFEFALNSLGGTCVLASEIDKKANESYKILFGEETAGDVTKLEEKEIQDHDLLVGGFPCQAFSIAGHRKGFDDTRGTLFFQIARIAKEKQPKAMILENVKGLLSHDNGKTLDVICQTLDEIGYTYDINILNSKFFNVPQNRERLYFVCIRKDLIQSEPWDIAGNSAISKAKKRIKEYGFSTFNFDWNPQDTISTTLSMILEDKPVDERYYIREYMVNEILEKMQDKHTFREGIHPINPTKDECSYTITRSTHALYHYSAAIAKCRAVIISELIPFDKVTQDDLDRMEIPIKVEEMLAESKKEKYVHSNRYRGEELNRLAKGSIVYGLGLLRVRKLTPKESLRIQGFPEDTFQNLYENGMAITNIFKQAGNAVTVNVVKDVAERLLNYLEDKLYPSVSQEDRLVISDIHIDGQESINT